MLATLYVDNPGDFAITTDQGAPGFDAGDTVTWTRRRKARRRLGSRFDLRHRRVFHDPTAVNAAVDGVQVIHVAPGTFAELVSVDRTLDGSATRPELTLAIAPPSPTIVNGNAGATGPPLTMTTLS